MGGLASCLINLLYVLVELILGWNRNAFTLIVT